MSENKTQLPPGSEGSPFAAALGGIESVKRDPATRSTRPPVEPTMRALRRIIGDEVLDIFPDGLTDTIDALFKAHGADKNTYAEIEFDTADERNDLLALMRAYAECAGEKGYTIRTDSETAPEVLRFRVTVRRGSAESASA